MLYLVLSISCTCSSIHRGKDFNLHFTLMALFGPADCRLSLFGIIGTNSTHHDKSAIEWIELADPSILLLFV